MELLLFWKAVEPLSFEVVEAPVEDVLELLPLVMVGVDEDIVLEIVVVDEEIVLVVVVVVDEEEIVLAGDVVDEEIVLAFVDDDGGLLAVVLLRAMKIVPGIMYPEASTQLPQGMFE